MSGKQNSFLLFKVNFVSIKKSASLKLVCEFQKGPLHTEMLL